MMLDKKAIDEFREIYRKENGQELTDAEASDAAYRLYGFAELALEVAKRDIQRKRQLQKEPGGFHITDGTYNCMVCGVPVTGDQSWYDRYGVKCLLCQRAVNKGIIPGFVCTARDSHYGMWELKSKFNIISATARKLIRQGKLHARVVLTNDGKPYEYIFLKKENPQLISRYSPERKSYDRHRDKEARISDREWKIKIRDKFHYRQHSYR